MIQNRFVNMMQHIIQNNNECVLLIVNVLPKEWQTNKEQDNIGQNDRSCLCEEFGLTPG